ALSHFAQGELVIGIAAHQRREIEGNAQTGAALLQQSSIALVGLFGRTEARKLPHRPRLAAIAGCVNASSVRKLAGIPEIARVVDIRDALGRVETLDRTLRLFRVGRSSHDRIIRALSV